MPKKRRGRRPDKTGSVFYSKSKKRWIARWKGRESSASTEAAAYLLLGEMQHDSPVKTSEVTVKRFLELHLEYVKENFAPSTYDSYHNAIHKHILPELGVYKVQELNAVHIEEWLRESKAGQRTKQNAYAVLNSALNRALKQQVIQVNPCCAVDKPRVRQPEKKPFSIEEVNLILNECRKHRIGGVVELAIRLGMRQCELFGLKWKDIDWQDMSLVVCRNVTESFGVIHEGETKTRSSMRRLPLDDKCHAVLHERRVTAMREGHAKPDDYVFPSTTGKPTRRGTFRVHMWNKMLKRLDIAQRGLHQARHTFATLGLSAGINPTAVSQILGHSKVSTTVNEYSAYIPDDAIRVVDALRRKIDG